MIGTISLSTEFIGMKMSRSYIYDMAVLSRESFGMEEAMEIEIELCEVSRVSLGGKVF